MINQFNIPARKGGRYIYQLMYIAYWVALFPTKKSAFASMNIEQVYADFQRLYPHLLLTKHSESYFVGVRMPQCKE